MSIAERILGLIAAVLLLPLFAAGLLLIVGVANVGKTLVESYGVPQAPIGVMVTILNVGILIGTLALAFIIMLRVRRRLAVRSSLFRLEGEGPAVTESRSRDPDSSPSSIMARVRRLDARLASKPPNARSRGRRR
jgi:hypothetical protein